MCEANKPVVWDKTAISKGKNLYLVNWYYVANFGADLVWADSETDALDKYWLAGNKNVTVLVTQLDKANMPMIRRGVEYPNQLDR